MIKNMLLNDVDNNFSSIDKVEEKKETKVFVNSGMIPLRRNFSPTQQDVICSRGNIARNHKGNIKFRELVNENIEKYSMAKSKIEKSNIVWSIVQKIRSDSPIGGFVKKIESVWYEVGDHLAREKVGQCLRDLLHSQYRSSTKAKKRRRWEEQARVDSQMCKYLLHQSDCRDIINLIQTISSQKNSDKDLQQKFNQANCELLNIFKSGKPTKNNKYDCDTQQLHSIKRRKKRFFPDANVFSFDNSTSVSSTSFSLDYSQNMEPIPLNDIRELDHHVLRCVPPLYFAKNTFH